MNPSNNNGLIHLSSPHSVAATKRLEAALQSRGVAFFCHIDHSAEAKKVGMKMHPTQLLIFGNPKGGTPLMLAAPSIAIDLPFKASIWEEEAGGHVWVNSPEYLQQRHYVPPDRSRNLLISPLKSRNRPRQVSGTSDASKTQSGLIRNIAVIEPLLQSVVAD